MTTRRNSQFHSGNLTVLTPWIIALTFAATTVDAAPSAGMRPEFGGRAAHGVCLLQGRGSRLADIGPCTSHGFDRLAEGELRPREAQG